jgi:nucleoside-diphosphate-sugar epimerase
MFVVTGASGFLGRAVVEELSVRGLPVMAVSRRPARFDNSIQSLQVDHYSKLKPAGGGDVLLHLAEPRHIGTVEQAGSGHAAAMRETVSALVGGGWAHVIYASSAAVYGDDRAEPRHVDEAIRPRGAYAEAKAACESIVVNAGGGAARLANLYGPGMASNNIMSDILVQIGKPGPVCVRDLKPVRDYLWIEDAARSLVDAAAAKLSGAFNLGSGVAISVNSLVTLILSLAGESRAIEETAPAGGESRLVLDIAATTERLGWRPTVTLTDGLSRLVGVSA